jgi:glycylpeptide N-tetradecanoyltransferase
VEDAQTVTDFVSFYNLPSSILKHESHKILNAAYSYYNVTTTNRMEELQKDALVYARDTGHDVFNCLDVMENGKYLEN